MLKQLALVLALATSATLSAQEKKITVADFAGTWNIEFMSHQLALVIEPAEGNKVSATMMVMGRDIPLKGELVDRTLTLTGVKTEDASGGTAAPSHGDAAASNGPAAQPIVVTLQDDGTLAGEMMTNHGPGKWTAEKLKPRKKPQP